MRYLGIDYGEKRIGLSYGDELGIAVTLPAAVQKTKKERIQHIAQIIEQRRIQELVIGYPLNMNGSTGFKAEEVDTFVVELEKRFALKVHRIDERLTSKQALNDLHASQVKKPKTIKQQQELRASGKIDSRSAAIILQDFLDTQSNG